MITNVTQLVSQRRLDLGRSRVVDGAKDGLKLVGSSRRTARLYRGPLLGLGRGGGVQVIHGRRGWHRVEVDRLRAAVRLLLVVRVLVELVGRPGSSRLLLLLLVGRRRVGRVFVDLQRWHLEEQETETA